MRFLKILFWLLLGVVIAVFAIGNWTMVKFRLWGGLTAEVNLPLLLVLTFLAGLLPTLLYHHAVKWRMRQKLATAERAMADLRSAVTAAAAPPPLLDPGDDTPAPASIPTAVPPGVA